MSSHPPRKHFLWVTDPWETLDHPRDTTLRLAEEALSLGLPSHWCDVTTIRWENSAVLCDAREIQQIYPGRAEKSFHLGPAVPARASEFHSIHYRVDPPVDLAYLHPLQLLALGIEGHKHCELVNPAPALFAANEKLEAAALGDLMPASLASSRWETLAAFGRAEGKAVLKPLHEAQSHGIELLDWQDPESMEHARLALEKATAGFRRPVLLQRYLPGIAEGEQRLWFIDGELLAAVRKHPAPGDFRVNMDAGSRLAPLELDAKERRIAARIGRRLKARRIRLAAVDLIEGFVTDFNHTSPGLIPLMEAVVGDNLARPIVEAVAKPWRGRR